MDPDTRDEVATLVQEMVAVGVDLADIHTLVDQAAGVRDPARQISTHFVGTSVYLRVDNYEFQVVVPPRQLEINQDAPAHLAELLARLLSGRS